MKNKQWSEDPKLGTWEEIASNAAYLQSDDAGTGNFIDVASELAVQVTTLDSPETDAERVEAAMVFLKKARDLLDKAGCPKALARVRLAISSVKGATSNARHRQSAAERGDTRKRIRRAPKMVILTPSQLDRSAR
jgi:hypothetical protein